MTGSAIPLEHNSVKEDILGVVTSESCTARSSVIGEFRILYQHIVADRRIDRTAIIGGNIAVKDTILNGHDRFVETQCGAVVAAAVLNRKSIRPGIKSLTTGQVEETPTVFQVDDRRLRSGSTAKLDVIAAEVKILVAVAGINSRRNHDHIFKTAFL